MTDYAELRRLLAAEKATWQAWQDWCGRDDQSTGNLKESELCYAWEAARKALDTAAVDSLPGLLDKLERYEGALQWYAAPFDQFDDMGDRARAALNPTEANE